MCSYDGGAPYVGGAPYPAGAGAVAVAVTVRSTSWTTISHTSLPLVIHVVVISGVSEALEIGADVMVLLEQLLLVLVLLVLVLLMLVLLMMLSGATTMPPCAVDVTAGLTGEYAGADGVKVDGAEV